MKIVTVVGTRPEIIKKSMVLKLLDEVSEHVLVHTGQNFDKELNDNFFLDLKLIFILKISAISFAADLISS